MEKAEIIKQWIDDQKEVNPEALGWKTRKENEWYILERGFFLSFGYVYTILDSHSNLYFYGKISNQGELRILMKMLNINNNE